MDIQDPRLRSLLRQAKRAADSGKKAAAAQLYRQIIEEAPDTSLAWLGLAEVLNNPAEKTAAFERTLTLDPNNEAAQVGLARLRGELVADSPPIEETTATVVEEEDVTVVLPEPSDEAYTTVVTTEDETLFCYRHPDRETSLRCYKCGKPICSRCTRKTPVGYLCPDCQREAENTFFSATILDYLLVTMVIFPLSLLVGSLVLAVGGRFGFFFIFIMFFVGGAIGRIIGLIALRVARRRRGRYMGYLVAGLIVLGALLPALPIILVALLGGGGGAIFGALLIPGIYAFVAASSAFYWVK